MPFELKNIEVMYKKMMHNMFKYQIERNAEVYIYDITVKSKTIDSHLADLVEIFQILKKISICLSLTSIPSESTQESSSNSLFTRRE